MSDDRLKRLQEVLLQIAAGDFSVRVPVSARRDDVDAICVGVNMLAEELQFERRRREETQAELERARSEQQHEERRKMRALAELGGGVAHDMNNLLSVMMMVSEDMRDPDSGDHEALIDDLEEAIRKGTTLSKHLLAVSVDTAKRIPVDPGVALRSAGRLARRASPKGVAVSIEVPDVLPNVMADPGDLERAVLNLATNGIEAMPDGGSLRIEVTVDETDVKVRVRDTGMGMDAHTRSRATEPLFTTKPEGNGFGLALAYSLCEQAGGELTIDTVEGEGTTVALRLPAVVSAG